LFLPRFFDRFGYRTLFIVGAISGVCGGSLASLALYLQHFWLFCASGTFIGLFQATAMYYRYAAADSVAVEHKSTAIAWVLNGGVLSALFSKYIANGSLHLFALDYLGSYVVLSGLALAAVPVLAFAPLAPRRAMQERHSTLAHVLAKMDGAALTAVTLCSMSYFVMAMVMLASPLAMSGCGFHASDAASVIQWHLLGMFAPSLLTGKLIARFGAMAIAMAGLVLLALSCVLAMRDQTWLGFHVALAFVGVGWNLMYLAGSTLLTVIRPPEIRSRVQSLTEFATFAVTTVVAGATGWLYDIASWLGVLTLALGCLFAVAALVITTQLRAAPRV
jgi:MFS family permease